MALPIPFLFLSPCPSLSPFRDLLAPPLHRIGKPSHGQSFVCLEACCSVAFEEI